MGSCLGAGVPMLGSRVIGCLVLDSEMWYVGARVGACRAVPKCKGMGVSDWEYRC